MTMMQLAVLLCHSVTDLHTAARCSWTGVGAAYCAVTLPVACYLHQCVCFKHTQPAWLIGQQAVLLALLGKQCTKTKHASSLQPVCIGMLLLISLAMQQHICHDSCSPSLQNTHTSAWWPFIHCGFHALACAACQQHRCTAAARHQQHSRLPDPSSNRLPASQEQQQQQQQYPQDVMCRH